jgi:hypothetical protein
LHPSKRINSRQTIALKYNSFGWKFQFLPE